MKKIILFLLIIFSVDFVDASGRLQNEDFKSLSELQAAGGSISQLLNDTKIYVSANGINQQLSAAITSGMIGAAGGGSGIIWIEDVLAPTPAIDVSKTRVYTYGSGLGQQLFTTLKVPYQWPTGSQIKLIVPFTSPDSSGSVLVQCVATLIRASTDVISSTTYQRTSTNSAVTMTAGLANTPIPVVCDLTDATGNISGISVGVNDVILIKLSRGTDTAASDINVFANQAEFALR